MPPSEFVVKTVYWFFLYGCIGWGVEVVYAAIKEHKLVNRGFLCGPICPIYGFGMVGLVYSVSLIPMPSSGSMSAVAIFFIGMILTTTIELVGGWALFKVYRIRWWDYSNMKFNLGGYICPQFSLLWGLGSVLMIKVVHPLLARGSNPMPFKVMLILDIVLFIFFVVDVIVSTAAAIGLNKYLREIDELRARLRVTSDKLTTVLGTSAMTADTILDEQKLQLALAKLEGRENAAELRAEVTARVGELREKLTAADHDFIGAHRLLRAFPDMKSLNYADTLARGSNPMPFKVMLILDIVLFIFFVVDVIVSTAAAIGLNKYLREIDELRARLRVTSDKLTTVLGTSAMTADTILDEQKLQLALAKLEGRENAAELRAEVTARVGELREKLTAADHDFIGAHRLLRAFPDMKSLNYADTLAATRAATQRLRELAAAAKAAAKETAANAAEKIKKA